MSEHILQTSNLSRHFGGVKALSNVDVSIKKGSIHAIIGPNGSGKTTFINVVTGFYKPDNGTIEFDGKNITNLPPHMIAQTGIGRTFQNLRLFSSMDAGENIKTALHLNLDESIGKSMLGLKKIKEVEIEAERKTDEILKKLDIFDMKHLKVAGLSYGMRRIVEIGRALSLNPSLLILDEPVAGMNLTEGLLLMDKIKLLVAEGISILLIEHDMNIVMGFSDEITVLNHGEVIARGTPAEIQNNPSVIEAYLGKDKKQIGDDSE